MGKLAGPDDLSSNRLKLSEVSQVDSAAYIESILGSVQRIAENKNMPMLAHLIGLARVEAKRNC